jgi:hypothetical protein
MANGVKLAEFAARKQAERYIEERGGNDPANVEQMFIVKQQRG